MAEPIGFTTDQMKRIMADYEQAINEAWKDIVSKAECGDPLCKERMTRSDTVDFVWKLLKSNAIEHAGRSNDHQSELARTVSRRLDVPLDVAQRELARLVAEGNLTCTQAAQQKHATWQWT